MRIVLTIMSKWSGVYEANSRALEGLLEAVGGMPGVREAVTSRLERDYAAQLGNSENEISIGAYSRQFETLDSLATHAAPISSGFMTPFSGQTQ